MDSLRTVGSPLHPASRALFACVALGAASWARQTCGPERIGLDQQGNQGTLPTQGPAISANGRFVVFSSFSPLVPSDVGVLSDVYLLDRASGALELISVTPSGTGGNADSPKFPMLVWAPLDVSDDGRWVAWISEATDLAPNASYPGMKAFVRDRAGAQTHLVSTNAAGVQAEVTAIRLSGDGRFVGFVSMDALLPTAGLLEEVYLRDLQTGALEVASLDWNGQASAHGHFQITQIDLSYDGRFVTFDTRANDLVPGGTTLGRTHVYRRDRLAGSTVLVSAGVAGVEGSKDSWRSRCSADGRYVVFDSLAQNLDVNDTLWLEDVFVRDMVSGTTRHVSRSAAGSLGNGHSWRAEISPDGQFVSYLTAATNLVPGDTNAADDVLLFDRVMLATIRISTDSQGNQGNGNSWVSALSSNARAIALDSFASNLVAGDTNQHRDVFLWQCTAPTAVYCTAKTNSLGCVPAIQAQGIPALSWGQGFEIGATNVRNQAAGSLVYGLAGPAALPFHGGTFCLQQPAVRTGIQSSHGSSSGADCTGSYRFDFLVWASTGVHPALIAGTQVWAQYWSRDGGFAWPDNVGLTDALTFTLEP